MPSGLLDFVFGSGTLKKAAGDTGPVDKNYVPATPDTAKAAQDYADKRLADQKAKAKAPPATESSPGYDWRQDKRNQK